MGAVYNRELAINMQCSFLTLNHCYSIQNNYSQVLADHAHRPHLARRHLVQTRQRRPPHFFISVSPGGPHLTDMRMPWATALALGHRLELPRNHSRLRMGHSSPQHPRA